jgi:2-polyprenyl-6-methoxyphenol hydroxylase-like FAD-dependent oxidoreductase
MPERMKTGCCIVGGGPAGMMLGFLLARAGVEVAVLEKHADFFRDFRGDTIHPSSLEVMHELGLLEQFLRVPHQELPRMVAMLGDEPFPVADFSRLPTRCRFIAFMPQWDFLDFLAAQGRRYPKFRLMMNAEVTDLVREGGRIAGVRAKTPQGEIEVRAALVVGCDGRHSTVRERAGLEVRDFGAPMDVFWFHLARNADDPTQAFGFLRPGKLIRIMIMLDRGDYWQAGAVIPKGWGEKIRAAGLPAFREDVARIVPFARRSVEAIRDFDELKLLTVKVDRLTRWHLPGLLCIGDAAHAMSPVGGIGVNIALQDAVAAANMLYDKFGSGTVAEDDLRAVQSYREGAVRRTQAVQIFMQNQIFRAAPGATPSDAAPLPFRLLKMLPILQRLTARFVGLGFQPENVKTPERA